MSPFRPSQQVTTFHFRWVMVHCRESGRRRQSQGMAQLVVMLLMLTVLTTSLAIASRVTAGLYSQSLQARLRLARDAAEYGLTLYAHELNKPGNRLLLGTIASDWHNKQNGITVTYKLPNRNDLDKTFYIETYNMYDDNVIPRDISNGDKSGRPCYIYSKEGYTNNRADLDYVAELDGKYKTRVYMTTYQAANMHRIPAQYYSNNHQSFQLLSMQLYSSDHVTKLDKAPPDDISYLVMVMQGTYNGTVSDSTINKFTWQVDAATGIDLGRDVKYVIQQEFEVVPRCCGSSFGKLTKGNGATRATKVVGTDPQEIIAANGNNNCPNNTQVVWLLRSVTRTANFLGQA